MSHATLKSHLLEEDRPTDQTDSKGGRRLLPDSSGHPSGIWPDRRLFIIPVFVAIFFFGLISWLEPSIALAISMQVHPDLSVTMKPAFLRSKIWIVVAALYTLVALFFIHRNKVPENKAGAPDNKSTASASLAIEVSLFSTLIVALVVSRALQFPYCIDDAYIYFKYVRNIVEHWRPEYELGARAVGFTSHLHVIFLSALSLVSACRNLPLIAQMSNIALDVLTATILFVTARRLFAGSGMALLAMALYVVSFFNIGEVCRGKESSMLVFLLALSIWARSAEKPSLAASIAALVALTRPEGVFFLAATFFSQLPLGKTMQREAWIQFSKAWLFPSLLLGAVFGFLFLYFGTLMPQGLLAKATVYRLPSFVSSEQIFTHIMQEFTGCQIEFPALGSVVALCGLAVFCLALLWEYSALRVFLVSLVLVACFFLAGNALMKPFPWYFAWWTLLAPFTLCALFRATFKQRGSVQKTFAAAVLISCLLFSSWQTCLNPKSNELDNVKLLCRVQFPLPIFSWDPVQERVRLYEEAARYLNDSAQSLKLVATGELGMVGYMLRSRVLDLHGMTDPEMLKLYPVALEKFSPTCTISFPPEFARVHKPDRILTLDTFVRNGLLADEYFLNHYEVERRWPCKVWGSDYLLLFKPKQQFLKRSDRPLE